MRAPRTVASIERDAWGGARGDDRRSPQRRPVHEKAASGWHALQRFQESGSLVTMDQLDGQPASPILTVSGRLSRDVASDELGDRPVANPGMALDPYCRAQGRGAQNAFMRFGH